MDVRWHHLAMAVRDIDRIVPFYRDLLGFEVDWEKPHYSGERFARLILDRKFPGAVAFASAPAVP